MQLLTIPDTEKSFTIIYADEAGIEKTETFFIETELSMARYRMLERFQREIVTGLTHLDYIELLKKNVANLNKAMSGGKVLAEMSYDNINALNHANNLEAKEPFEVWICTLFINTKDEDRTVFDTAVMQRKISQWGTIDMGFFIALAESVCGLSPGSLHYRTLNHLDLTDTTPLPQNDPAPTM